MSSAFFEYCESLWKSWLEGRLVASPFVDGAFDLDAAPEPYLSFRTGASPLFVLTTNPGGTMPHQLKSSVAAGAGPLNASMSYAAAASALGAFYEDPHNLKGPANRRIAALQSLARLVGRDGVFQVEACPFHSESFPGKGAFLDSLDTDGLLSEYVGRVQSFLRDRPVVIVAAVSTQVSLGPSLQLSKWLLWQANLAGLDLVAARFIPLVERRGKVTCGAFVSGEGEAVKALVLMMGGNHLPGNSGLVALSSAMLAAAPGRPA